MKDWNIFRCKLAANRIALSTQCTDMKKALHLLESLQHLLDQLVDFLGSGTSFSTFQVV